jgi:predicted site-specific integrase-resolvase
VTTFSTNIRETTMTFAIYERVSSRGQKLDSQHHDLETWAKGQQANGQAVKWYADK